MRIFPETDPAKTGFDPYIVERQNSLPKLVISKTLEEGSWRPETIVHSDPAEELARLKQGKDILILGSGSNVAAAVKAGLEDENRIRGQGG